jgi:hypothetical protein
MYIEELVFKTRKEAEGLLDNLNELISDYGKVTMEDVHTLGGVISTFRDSKVGWTDLKDAYVMKIFGGYAVHLPAPKILEQEHPLTETKNILNGMYGKDSASQKKDTTSFSVPNEDTYVAPYTICKKEVLQKSYIDTIGKTINYLGTTMKVTGVTITEKYITVILE